MASVENYLIAVDLGASGGKMARGIFNGEKLSIQNYHPFPNQPIQFLDSLYWDVFALYKSILSGMQKYTAEWGPAQAIAIDTWGATYGLLDSWGRLAEPVFHYRDHRTQGIIEEMDRLVSPKERFLLSGCQCNPTYTLPQLYSCVQRKEKSLEHAETLLFLPDLLSYFLSGEISTEITIAGTSALLDASQEKWSKEIFEKYSIPTHFLTKIVDAGTIKGKIVPHVAQSTGVGEAKVVATVSHDSAAAVAAIPGFGSDSLYVSIGTNISMGVESDAPLLTDEAFQGGFKNTGGLGRKKIVYRDFPAFWVINRLMESWRREGKSYSFDDLHNMAEQATSIQAYLDIEDPVFANPSGDMVEIIQNYLSRTNQSIPSDTGEMVRCVFESIALKVRHYALYLKNKLGFSIEKAFVINGGCRNKLLVQMISDALDLPVQAGLPSATLAGNLLTQLYAVGNASSLSQIREISAQSFYMESYTPQDKGWIHAIIEN